MSIDARLLETAPDSADQESSDSQIGRYVVRRVVGSGGMGIVLAAHDPELDREVAIKIVVTGETGGAIREAQAMARLSHPNVVQVHEVIRLGERTAIVMELVEGEELRTWQKERGWREIVGAYVQASRGLAAAHRAGIVHRDFKPSNALVDREGVVRVTDFGLARATASTAATTSNEVTSVAGTPAYMAPEQHRGGPLDARTDQWGLGCALYEALYGRRPFASAEGADLAAAVIRGDLDAEPADSPVPRRIRVAIRRALATDPDERFASIDDFAGALTVTPRGVRYAIGATVAIVLLGSIALIATRGGASSSSACEGLDRPIREVWTDAARAGLRVRLLAPGVGLPESTVDRALRGLDAYAASWTTTRTAACTDSQQGVRSHDTLDLRMRCLDRRLAEVSGLLDGLATGGPDALRATSDAVAQLRPATGCADAKELDVRPASAALRAELDVAEGNVARATALLSLGQFERALPLVERAVVAGEHANDGSLIARALVIRGECEDRLGKYAAALATYQRAAKSAATAQDHSVMADALTRAFLVEGDHLGRRADALRNQPYVELALASAGQPDDVRAEWLHHLAILLYDDSARTDDAAAYEREALAIRQRTLPPGHMYLIDSIETLANIEGVRKNFDESARLLNQVLDARVAARGPNDAMVSHAYNNLGVLEVRRAQLPAAVGYLQRAVEVAHASGQPNTAAEFNVGILQLELGRWTAAAKTFAAALETSERVAGKQSRDAADSAMFLAVAWIATGELERARPMLQRGIDDARRAGSPSLATALTHAARLALHDGDLARAHALLDEANALPPTNGALRKLAAAEIARAEGGCRAARPLLVETLADTLEDERRMVQSLATVELAECEAAAGDDRAARDRLEAELAWLTSAGADDLAAAPARNALAKLRR